MIKYIKREDVLGSEYGVLKGGLIEWDSGAKESSPLSVDLMLKLGYVKIVSEEEYNSESELEKTDKLDEIEEVASMLMDIASMLPKEVQEDEKVKRAVDSLESIMYGVEVLKEINKDSEEELDLSLSHNELRHNVIVDSKHRVDALLNLFYNGNPYGSVTFKYNNDDKTVEAIVFDEKNEVVENHVHTFLDGKIYNKAIGKAIALTEVFGLEAPDKYINAIQPSEIVEGMILEVKNDGLVVLDDSNAVYEEQ